MDKHEKQLYLTIKEIIQDSKHKSPLQIDGQIFLILDKVEELILLRKNDVLLEAAKIIKSEYENPSELPYTHMVNHIKDKMTENHAKITKLIKKQLDNLSWEAEELEYED
nr:MAG TPA: hypothetical protein [Caudoviricetes sp.]